MRLVIFLLTLSALGQSAFAETVITGDQFRVVDGDTVHIGNHKIRLIGIDAPERHQQCRNDENIRWDCGRVATDMLAGMLESADGGIRCVITGRDKYQRLLGTCYANMGDGGSVEGGIDVQKALIRSGFAVAEYADQYIPDEEAARKAERGIWSGCFTRPKKWRRKHRDCD